MSDNLWDTNVYITSLGALICSDIEFRKHFSSFSHNFCLWKLNELFGYLRPNTSRAIVKSSHREWQINRIDEEEKKDDGLVYGVNPVWKTSQPWNALSASLI